MMYELEGTVKVVMETQTFGSGFTKREFVVTTDEKFPQDVKFECVKERTALLDPLGKGDRVKVGFYIRGNEYKERYYVNLNASKVDKLDGGEAEAGAVAPGEAPYPTADDTDIPF